MNGTVEGIEMKQTNLKRVWPGLVAAIFLSLPLFIPDFFVHLLSEFFILALFAVSFNLVFGYGKMVSIGHAAFYAIGGYSYALLVKGLAMSMPLALLTSALFAALAGLVIGFFCIRLTGFYLAFISLAFAQLVWVVIWKWYDVTGGDNGLIGVLAPSLIAPAPEAWRFYYLVLIVVSVCVFILWRITRSAFGFSLRATSQNAERAEFIGINVVRARLMAWVISAFFSGVAGCLMVLSLGGAYPNMAHFEKTLEVTLMALVGGMNTFLGPLVGAAILVFLHYFLTLYTEYWMIIMGTILLMIILFLPSGIVGYARERLGEWQK